MAHTPLQVGHVALNVRDMRQAEKFYTEVIGLEIASRTQGAIFLTCGTLHHDLVLFQAPDAGEGEAPAATGLNHIAFQLHDRAALRARHDHLQQLGIDLRPTEHNTTLSLYFHDPDGNRLELYCDKAANGLEIMRTKGPMSRPMDVEQLERL